MTTYTLQELTTPRTREQLEAAIYAAIAARGADPSTWKPGAPTRAMITGIAVVLAAMDRLVAAITKSGFLYQAEGDWLTHVARYTFFVERQEGSYAAGNVVLTNTGGGVYEFEPGDLIVRNATTGKGYRNTSPIFLRGASTVTAPVVALELGRIGNAAAGAITDFETTLFGVTVTNPIALVGTDPESDNDLRERCAAKMGSLSPNGPRDAYVFAARSAKRADGSSIGVTRVRFRADGYGNVDVICAPASGELAGTVGDLTSDLGIVDAEIQKVVPHGVTAHTLSATPLAIPVTYELWIDADCPLSDSEIATGVQAALERDLGEHPIGGHKIIGAVLPPGTTGRVHRSVIEGAITSPVVEHVIKLALIAPAADVDLSIAEAPAVGAVAPPVIHRVVDP